MHSLMPTTRHWPTLAYRAFVNGGQSPREQSLTPALQPASPQELSLHAQGRSAKIHSLSRAPDRPCHTTEHPDRLPDAPKTPSIRIPFRTLVPGTVPDRCLDGSENPGTDVSAFRRTLRLLRQNALPQRGEKSQIRKRGTAYAVPLFYQARRAKARRNVF